MLISDQTNGQIVLMPIHFEHIQKHQILGRKLCVFEKIFGKTSSKSFLWKQELSFAEDEQVKENKNDTKLTRISI